MNNTSQQWDRHEAERERLQHKAQARKQDRELFVILLCAVGVVLMAVFVVTHIGS